jgi:hypothetical protein
MPKKQNETPVLLRQETEEQPKEKQARKAGRTLLLKNPTGTNVSYDTLEGLQHKSETKTTNSVFLTFDTVENSLKAYKQLRSEQSETRVKFSYYRLFFTIEGLTDTTDYTTVKQELTKWVESKASTNMLYCKLYRKDSKYIGCGDFTVDTLSGMNTLLNKDDGLKEFSFGPFKGTFYRFNNTKKETTETL